MKKILHCSVCLSIWSSVCINLELNTYKAHKGKYFRGFTVNIRKHLHYNREWNALHTQMREKIVVLKNLGWRWRKKCIKELRIKSFLLRVYRFDKLWTVLWKTTKNGKMNRNCKITQRKRNFMLVQKQECWFKHVPESTGQRALNGT